jgi:heat shock protein HslJ
MLALALPVIPAMAAGSDRLAGSEWRPVEIAGAATPEDVEVFLQFRAEGAVAGLGGCNRFSGSYAPSDTSLEFGPLAATMMACPDPQMQVEQRFFGAVSQVRGFARDRVDLTLTDADGAPLIVLIQLDAD